MQNRFQRQVVADPDDDMDNMEDEQLALAVRNTGLPARRICLLCPAGFSLLVSDLIRGAYDRGIDPVCFTAVADLRGGN